MDEPPAHRDTEPDETTSEPSDVIEQLAESEDQTDDTPAPEVASLEVPDPYVDPEAADWDAEDDEPASGSARLLADRYGDFRRAQIAGVVGFGDGPVVGGDQIVNNTYYSELRRILRPGPLRLAEVERLRVAHIEVEAQRHLRARLRTHRLQMVRGRSGSGRGTTAILALDELGWSVEILDSVQGFGIDVASELKLRRRHGCVVDVLDWEAGQPSHSLLAHLRDAAEQAGACLVLLIGDDIHLDETLQADYTVTQLPPPGEDVLEAHLGALLTKEELNTLNLDLQTDDLASLRQERLRDGYRLGEVVRFAGQLAQLARGGLDRSNLVAMLRSERRADVQAWLTYPAEPFGPGGTPTLWERTLLLAAAVLNGFPLGRVTAAADRLAALLHDVEAPDTQLARTSFHDRVRACSAWLTVSQHGRARGLPGKSRTRRVQLRSDVLTDIVLEVVWSDFDGVHVPLARWLRELASGRSPLVQRRVSSSGG